jgi:hypothetical protein
LVRSHLHKNILGNVGNVVVVTYLWSDSISEELVEHPIDGLHAMSCAKLNLAIGGVIHKCHLTIQGDLSTMKLWTTKIFFTETKNVSEPLRGDLLALLSLTTK